MRGRYKRGYAIPFVFSVQVHLERRAILIWGESSTKILAFCCSLRHVVEIRSSNWLWKHNYYTLLLKITGTFLQNAAKPSIFELQTWDFKLNSCLDIYLLNFYFNRLEKKVCCIQPVWKFLAIDPPPPLLSQPSSLKKNSQRATVYCRASAKINFIIGQFGNFYFRPSPITEISNTLS